jgi:hypothetical protein
MNSIWIKSAVGDRIKDSRRLLGGLPMVCAAMLALWLGGHSLFAAEEAQSPDPLGDIVQDMNVATRWLSKLATDALTQETQKDAVDKLDKLIAELEKRAQAGNGPQSSPNPSRPMADSMIKAGPGGMGKLHAADQDGKHWADLPAHERERILQSMTEGFPSHYQGVLEAYFKRIAEEKPLQAEERAPASTGVTGGSASPVGGKSDAASSAALPGESTTKNSDATSNPAN